MRNSQVLSGLIAVCIGDALGVPVEFSSRNQRRINPVTEMIGYGPHNQPPGAWYDDSFMTLCLAECLCNGFDLEAIANSFYRCYKFSLLSNFMLRKIFINHNRLRGRGRK